jgi:hypothetical protein
MPTSLQTLPQFLGVSGKYSQRSSESEGAARSATEPRQQPSLAREIGALLDWK